MRRRPPSRISRNSTSTCAKERWKRSRSPSPRADLDIYDPQIATVPDEKKIAMAKEVERIAMAQDKRITNSEGGSFSNTEREAGLFNSKGISCVLKETSCGFSPYVIAGEGDT